jgi:hypothetical protein
MPRAKSKQEVRQANSGWVNQPRKVQKGDEWGGFVQVSIDEAHREEFDQWRADFGPRTWEDLDNALGCGLKLTAAYDGQNQCYIASLTGRPDYLGERAFTCCLSARGGTLDEAIAVLMYKHTSLLGLDWWDAVNQPKKSHYTFG